MNETQKPLSVRQAAEFLNLKPSYVYNLVHFGKLSAFKPSGKILLFKLSDLDKFAYGNPVGDHSERAESILNAAQKRKPRKKSKVS